VVEGEDTEGDETAFRPQPDRVGGSGRS
jgi:hypothetical protein